LARNQGPSLFEAFRSLPDKGTPGLSKKPDETTEGGEAPSASRPKSLSLGHRADIVIEASRGTLVLMVMLLVVVCGIFYVLGRVQAVASLRRGEQASDARVPDRSGEEAVSRADIPRAPVLEVVEKAVVGPKPEIIVEEREGPQPRTTQGPTYSVRIFTADASPKGEASIKSMISSLKERSYDAFSVKIRKTSGKEQIIVFVGRFKSSKSKEITELRDELRKIRYGAVQWYKGAMIQQLPSEENKDVDG